MSLQERVLSYYRNLAQIQELAALERVGNIYRLLNIPLPSTEIFFAYGLDPKYIFPGSRNIALHDDWRQQRFMLGFLLLEAAVGKVVESIDDVHFFDQDTVNFEVTNREAGDELNTIVADLLNSGESVILTMEQLAARLRALLFQFIPLKKYERFWASPLVSKERFGEFLRQQPEWQPEHRLPGSKYLNGYEGLEAHLPVRGINGKAAQAYCDWLSSQYCLDQRYALHRKKSEVPGFRLLTPDEHRWLAESRQLGDNTESLTELVADGKEIKTYNKRSGTYQTYGEDLATTTSVFRFCVEREET